MQIVAKYSRSVTSSNLKDDAHHHSTEALAAVALSSALGSNLFRVKYANDATEYNSLLEKWREIVKKKSIIRSWPDDISTRKVARISLEYWLDDICRTCKGRGHLPIVDVDKVLSDDPCPCCNGTTKKPIEAHNRIIDYVTDMVKSLENMALYSGDQATKKLSCEFDFIV